MLGNIVLAWNASRMHEVIERLKRDGIRIEDEAAPHRAGALRTSTFGARCGSGSRSTPMRSYSARPAAQRERPNDPVG